MVKGVVSKSAKGGMTIRTEIGAILSTKQTGIAIGVPVLVAYNHDRLCVEHVWERDEDNVQDEPLDLEDDT